jgi:hypothetical protein
MIHATHPSARHFDVDGEDDPVIKSLRPTWMYGSGDHEPTPYESLVTEPEQQMMREYDEQRREEFQEEER